MEGNRRKYLFLIKVKKFIDLSKLIKITKPDMRKNKLTPRSPWTKIFERKTLFGFIKKRW
jgi:hypothetical protein